MRRHKPIVRLIIGMILAVALAFFMLPVVWMFLTSFKTNPEVFTVPPSILPNHWNLTNYNDALVGGGGWFSIRDSLIVSLSTALISVIVGALAAFSLARFRTGGEQFSFWILSTRMFPPIASALPLFLIFRALKLLDTYYVLVVANTIFNLPFAIWLLKGFIEDAPRELEEAAVIDGTGQFGAFWRVTVPLIAPGLVVSVLFSFIFTWNEFMFALLLSGKSVRTVTLLVSSMVGGHQILWGQIAATGVVAIIPGVLLALFLQRYIVRGLTMGALKY